MIKSNCAVMTITGETNYGNRLQNYALEYVLTQLNVNAFTISRHYNKYRGYTKKEMIYALYRLLIYRKSRLPLERISSFKNFDKRFVNRYLVKNYDDINLSDIKCDYVVCGSDQIWNFNFFSNQRDLFFAKFISPKNKVAFSASIGMDYIPEKYIDYFKDAVNEFKSVSVREERAAQIIYELTGRKVPVTLDPTLMLDRDEWLEIAKKPSWIKNDKFLLTYFLGDIPEDILKYIKSIAEYYNLKIVNLYPEFADVNTVDRESFCAGPDEFVWLVANCDGFITDSFHGCVFSTIFEKTFRWFSREERGVANMNSRMDTLFSKLKIGSWCIGDTTESVEKFLYKDFSNVKENLDYEKKFALDYLMGALELNEDEQK